MQITIIISEEHSNLIGQTYNVCDNSYIENKRTGEWESLYHAPNLVIVSPKPYVAEITTRFTEKVIKHQFIDVMDLETNEIYRVLYNPSWVEW